MELIDFGFESDDFIEESAIISDEDVSFYACELD